MAVAYDVVVAGGGPAGLSAAERMAARGLHVVVVEKHAEIGSPTRTSGGSFIAGLEALDMPSALYHPVHDCRLLGPSAEASFSYAEPIGCVLDVRALYQYLAERAIVAGAEIRLQTQALTLVYDGDRIEGVTTRTPSGGQQSLSCSLLVDATGFSSTLAIKAGVHASYRRAGVGAEYDLYAPHFPEHQVVLAVGHAIAPAGYAWAFPYGHHRVRAGIGVLRPDVSDDPADYLDGFIQSYGPLRAAFVGASPVERHTGVIPGEGPNARLVADGLMTVGDAAGQASALFGEGIRFAIRAGRLAGEVGARAVARGDVSAPALVAYQEEWRRRFGRSHGLAYEANKILYGATDPEWDAIVRALGRCSAGQFARLLATDLSVGLALGIVARNPRVLGTAARLLKRARSPRVIAGAAS